jgi:type IV/VI secretion system ImpK/VasF family protein
VSLWTLGRAAGDLIAYVQLFQQAPPEARPDPATLRNQILGLLDAFARDPTAQSAPPVDLEEARFALVAWADESILRTDWSGRQQWLGEPLQLQLFRTNRAGDEFFERLARLRAEQTDAREVFFLCLVFGFEGGYADREPERRALIAQQFEMLRVARRAVDVTSLSPVTPTAYEVEIELSAPRGRSVRGPLLMIGAACLGLFGLLFGILFLTAGVVPTPGS